MPDGFKNRVQDGGRDNRSAPLQGLELGMAMGKERLITTSSKYSEPYMTRNLGAIAIDEEDNECT